MKNVLLIVSFSCIAHLGLACSCESIKLNQEIKGMSYILVGKVLD